MALAVAIVTRAPGVPSTMEPAAATPVLTTYLFVVSAAKVTTSPARTVPEPVTRAMVETPGAVDPDVT